MNVTRQWTREHELLHWLLVIVAAIVVILAVARALGAFDALPEPRLLPEDLGALAQPIAPEVVQPFFPESPPGRQLPPAEAAERLWTILALHRGREPGRAIDEWMQVGLQQETAHWREIALGAAFLESGDLKRAAMHCEAAQQLMPGHAVIHYYTGLLRLEQAAAAGRVPDDLRRGDLLVSYTPMEDRAVYRMVAIRELEAAIAGGAEVDFDERLVVGDPQFAEEVCAPTVGDLLTSLGADRFVGKAHHVLFGLRLDQGELAVAEHHLDCAAEAGMAVLHGYRDLGEAYLLAGEHGTAIRLGWQDLEVNHPKAGRLMRWLVTAPHEGWLW